jgi:hypothetical protein
MDLPPTAAAAPRPAWRDPIRWTALILLIVYGMAWRALTLLRDPRQRIYAATVAMIQNHPGYPSGASIESYREAGIQIEGSSAEVVLALRYTAKSGDKMSETYKFGLTETGGRWRVTSLAPVVGGTKEGMTLDRAIEEQLRTVE